MALRKIIEKYVVIEEQQNARSQLVLEKHTFDKEYVLILDEFDKVDIFDPHVVENHIRREKLKRSMHFFGKLKNMFTVDSL